MRGYKFILKHKINKTVYLINAFSCEQLKFINSDTISILIRIFIPIENFSERETMNDEKKKIKVKKFTKKMRRNCAK